MGKHLDFMSNEHMQAGAYIVQCDPKLLLRPTASMIDDCDALLMLYYFICSKFEETKQSKQPSSIKTEILKNCTDIFVLNFVVPLKY